MSRYDVSEVRDRRGANRYTDNRHCRSNRETEYAGRRPNFVSNTAGLNGITSEPKEIGRQQHEREEPMKTGHCQRKRGKARALAVCRADAECSPGQPEVASNRPPH